MDGQRRSDELTGSDVTRDRGPVCDVLLYIRLGATVISTASYVTSTPCVTLTDLHRPAGTDYYKPRRRRVILKSVTSASEEMRGVTLTRNVHIPVYFLLTNVTQRLARKPSCRKENARDAAFILMRWSENV